VDRDSARRRAVTSLLATELVGDVARRLGEAGIAVMPVKGALLQHWLYADPAERPLTDVDVLVCRDDLAMAVERLEAAGYRRTRHRTVGGMVMETPFGLALDLHSQLFDHARYRISTGDLFARSSPDSSLYGATVLLPSPLDVYAHLIGKFGSDHLTARSVAQLDEIARMSVCLDNAPEAAARHLFHCGMGRVSRYVLQLVYESTGDTFALQVHDRLPFDPIGRGVVAVARPTLATVAPDSRTGALMAHLLNESLPRGIRSGIRALFNRTRQG
jgi:hypothetical protein